MKNFLATRYFLLLPALAFLGCNSVGKAIFSKKSPREKYGEKIEKTVPARSAAWEQAGILALQNPLSIPVPYAETGFISGDKPDATGFYFYVKPGQKINVVFKKQSPSIQTTYLELWEVEAGNERKLLSTADTLLNVLEHATALPGNYILRMQPQLGTKGSYTLNILVGPMLGFPIEATAKPKVGSFWGDARDAGVRKHEGIDIFAKKGSKILAVADGVIWNVNETPIGGKIISLRPADQSFSVYYAHLDTQLVEDGQRVKKGDVIGTVGNTGNAKFTASHLHFGIYGRGGAVDPITFVQQVTTPQEPVAKKLNEWYTISSKTKLYPSPLRQNAYAATGPVKLRTESYSKDFYRVQLENGSKAFVPSNELTDKMKL
jgi:murein DD-endopeptidase MepM/ murein hydrolase activator NlpD